MKIRESYVEKNIPVYVEYKNSSRLRCTFLSSYTKVEAGYNP